MPRKVNLSMCRERKERSMNTRTKYLSILTFLISYQGNSAIYGDDNRIDIIYARPEIKSMARSTVVLLNRNYYKVTDKGYAYKYPLNTHAYENDLSKKVKFADQIPQGTCTGTLISPDEIMTAVHCVNGPKLKKSFFAFDFQLNESLVTPVIHLKENVFTGIKLINRPKVSDGIVFVKLDRPVYDRLPLGLSETSTLNTKDIFTIHYPDGLPAKFSDDAWIKNEYYSYEYGTEVFDHNLDTFHGSSGAPIFDQNTKKIVGVLMEGADDYKKNFLGRRYRVAHYSMYSSRRFETAVSVKPKNK